MNLIGFLAFEGVEELDLIGPWEMATMWRAYADGPDCKVIAKETGAIKCAKEPTIEAPLSFDDAAAHTGRLASFKVPRYWVFVTQYPEPHQTRCKNPN